MAAVQRVENDDAGKNYDPSSFKNPCPVTKTSDHFESDSVKAFHDALNDGDFHEERTEGEWVRLIIMQPIKGLFSHAFSQSLTIPPQRIAGSGYEIVESQGTFPAKSEWIVLFYQLPMCVYIFVCCDVCYTELPSIVVYFFILCCTVK